MDANPYLLDRDRARVEAGMDLNDLLAVTRDIVNEGTQLLARLLEEASRVSPRTRFHSAILLLLRHAIELADAADELLHAGVFTPAALQVRAIVETHAQMLFLVGKRTPYAPSPLPAGGTGPEPRDVGGGLLAGPQANQILEDRATAYLVAELRRQRDELEKIQTGAVETYLETLTGSKEVPPTIASKENQVAVSSEVARLNAELADSEHAPTDAVFTAARGKRSYDPSWFSINGGLPSVRQLAICVGLLGSYELFYGPASLVMHGLYIQGQLGSKKSSGGVGPAPLRYGGNRHLAYSVSAFLILETAQIYKIAIDAIRPSDENLWTEWSMRWNAVVRSL